jgi:hypothetical protein
VDFGARPDTGGTHNRFLCLAQFCDWDANERTEPGSLAPEKVGQELAIVTFVYDAAPNGAGGSQTL